MTLASSPVRTLTAGLLLATVIIVAFGPQSEAHDGDAYFPATRDADFTVRFTRSMADLPSQAHQRVVEGLHVWEDYGTIRHDVVTDATLGNWNPELQSNPAGACNIPNTPDIRPNSVHYRRYDGASEDAPRGADNAIAFVQRCIFTDRPELLRAAHMVIDRDETFYYGHEDQGCDRASIFGFELPYCPSPQYDLASVVTHEAGHYYGFAPPELVSGWRDHFDPEDPECQETEEDLHTMCPFVITRNTWLRSLEPHDIHTYQGAYGA